MKVLRVMITVGRQCQYSRRLEKLVDKGVVATVTSTVPEGTVG